MEIDDKHDDLPIKHDDLPIKNKVIYPLIMVVFPIQNGGFMWFPHQSMVIFPYFPHENGWFPLQKWCFSAASHSVAQGTDTAAIPDEPPSDEMLEKLSQEKTRRRNCDGMDERMKHRGVVAITMVNIWLIIMVNNG